ncbi:hypothetical protein CEUSTIGMA_g5829.t1 [Chlamydomonas eustigma]|uniref:CHRD domain-containing protein n=1 Tax=Chlamydomonas eustigma TaxID=1157962 RepID=A0A250X5L7_9CHLO|nr:hypothetical protein CEUSTIGMA_g5829.t1 [Chlamydomonas eustigma]|eukprot:GAX78387.1 hypothetical protein CEUSTIGMA_g5829.t1 [Chlamydomonas eustigma]
MNSPSVMLVVAFLAVLSAPCLGSSVEGRELKASMGSMGPMSKYYTVKVDALYYTSLNGKNVNTLPPVKTSSSGAAAVIVFNSSYALGSFNFSNIDGVYMAHIHNGSKTTNGFPIVWGLNSSCAGTLACAGLWQPFSVPAKSHYSSSYSFSPSLPIPGSNLTIGHQLSMGLAYFNVHTIAYQGGQIRGQFAPLLKKKTISSCFTTTLASGTTQACYLCGAGKGGPGKDMCYLCGSNMMPVTHAEATKIFDGVAVAKASGLF